MHQLLAQLAGEGLADRVEHLLLQQGVTREEQPEDRRDQQQHREQPEEREVGDPGGQQVALKTLRRPGPAAIARLKKEFRNVVDVGHANLVAVYELALDQARGEWYIAMEYVPGDSWLAHLRPAGERAPEAVLRAALGQLASGVYALHRAGLLHRDLKPSNVLVTGEGRLKIVDFGLARVIPRSEVAASIGDAMTRQGQVLGTARWMAPEVLTGGEPTPSSDVYAAGLVLFDLMDLGPLFLAGDARAQLRARVAADPELEPRVPPPLSDVLARMLSRDPALRYRDATTAHEAVIDEALRLIDTGLADLMHRELVSTDEVSDLLLDVRMLLMAAELAPESDPLVGETVGA